MQLLLNEGLSLSQPEMHQQDAFISIYPFLSGTPANLFPFLYHESQELTVLFHLCKHRFH